MTVSEITYLIIYAVGAADGKLGGGAKRITGLLNITQDEIEAKISNIDNIINEISKLPKEAIESILSTANFIMIADGKIDENEQAIVSKIEALLN